MDVEVKINARVFDYDQIIILGPVFPHEVVGFSGGNKYLFPGIAGPEILNFFHWLGAVITNPMIIGNKWTPVRKVVDRAAKMVSVDKLCFCLVVHGNELAGAFAGAPEAAWDEAIRALPPAAHRLTRSIPSIRSSPARRRCMTTSGPAANACTSSSRCWPMAGELIIYAPHITEISVTHGRIIEQIGYHCRDYFLKQWDRFKDLPWGVIAHSTHVRGIGTYEDGVEHCRARVTLATRIPREVCERINMGYRDPDTIRPEDYAGREAEGVLLVPKAGEMLYQLREPAPWASGNA